MSDTCTLIILIKCVYFIYRLDCRLDVGKGGVLTQYDDDNTNNNDSIAIPMLSWFYTAVIVNSIDRQKIANNHIKFTKC